MTIGEKIYELRTSAKLSQKDFAKLIGVSQTAVNFWENGKRQPKLEQLQKICNYFDISLKTLLHDDSCITSNRNTDPIFEKMFGDFYSPVDGGIADIHFTTDEYTIEEIEKILEYSRFLKSQRNK